MVGDLHLTTTFAALAEPTRRAILARLASSGEASVTELGKPFRMSPQTISKHLKVPETAGLTARGRDMQWPPCQLDPGPLKNAAEWLEQYRRFSEESLDRLDDYPCELRRKERKDGHRK